jgi:hypothetical protein
MNEANEEVSPHVMRRGALVRATDWNSAFRGIFGPGVGIGAAPETLGSPVFALANGVRAVSQRTDPPTLADLEADLEDAVPLPSKFLAGSDGIAFILAEHLGRTCWPNILAEHGRLKEQPSPPVRVADCNGKAVRPPWLHPSPLSLQISRV